MTGTNDIFKKFARRELSAKSTCLLNEWKAIHKLLSGSKYITYIIRLTNRDDVPEEYEIIYDIKSIIGVNEARDVKVKEDGLDIIKQLKTPIFGNQHKMQIKVPPDYPNAVSGKPLFKMITDVWHPNIRFTGDLKGRICLNESNLDAGNTLADRIMDVAYYLKYERYFALNEAPFPEDEDVALWIREEAEPNKWICPNGNLPTDDCDLYEKIGEDNREIPPIVKYNIANESSNDSLDGIEVVVEYEMEQQGLIHPDRSDEFSDNDDTDDEDNPFEC